MYYHPCYFHIGEEYTRADGKKVTIIAMKDDIVQGDDGADFYTGGACEPPSWLGWRYNRPNDAGRVTGSPHDMSHPFNLIPECLQ